MNDNLRDIRLYELGAVLSLFPKGASVLEIGGGAGWQAKALAEHGTNVQSIDVCGSQYAKTRVWPVQEYDGATVPFPDASFDVVFSSHTVEHVSDRAGLYREIRRVLKPNGTIVLVLPTASWRFMTMCAHYIFIVKAAFAWIGVRRENDLAHITARAVERHTPAKLLLRMLVAPRHGEYGNPFSELLLFSTSVWLRDFKRFRLSVIRHYPCRIFYTGYSIFGGLLGIDTRIKISRFGGSASHVYVLKPI